jgi:hypothetical protein
VPGLPEVPLEDRLPELLPNINLIKALGLPLNVTFNFNDLFVLIVALLFALGVAAFLEANRHRPRHPGRGPKLAAGPNLRR